jgi:hypothetical protein
MRGYIRLRVRPCDTRGGRAEHRRQHVRRRLLHQWRAATSPSRRKATPAYSKGYAPEGSRPDQHRPRRPARRWAVVLAALAVPGVLEGGCARVSPAASGGVSQAAPAPCRVARGTWTAAEPASPGSANNDLTGVAVLTTGDAWAVGSYADTNGGRTLAEHWNGTAWSVVPSPDPGGSGDFLSAVSAVSPSAIWAVGEYEIGGRAKR